MISLYRKVQSWAKILKKVTAMKRYAMNLLKKVMQMKRLTTIFLKVTPMKHLTLT
jgi:hypothetical protein